MLGIQQLYESTNIKSLITTHYTEAKTTIGLTNRRTNKPLGNITTQAHEAFIKKKMVKPAQLQPYKISR